jgi:cobalt-zinc-cadmium efflux system outer membrane protein
MRRNTIAVDLAGLRQRAFTQRPDLLALRQDHIRSEAELRLQLAQGKVDYTIGSEYRRQQGDSAFGNTIGFFLQTNLPVFNRNQGEIARATQEQSQVEAKVRALETNVQNDVEIAYLQYNNALTILNRVEGALLKQATDVRQITEYSYRRGEASFLEYLDAQRAYIETMQVYNEARGDFARSLYGIDAATGTTPSGGPIAKGPTP